MNAIRRKKLAALIDAIEDIKSQLEDQQSTLEELNDEEQEYFDNIPENLQSSERYERAETSSSALNEAYEALCDLLDQFESVTSSIEEAIDA